MKTWHKRIVLACLLVYSMQIMAGCATNHPQVNIEGMATARQYDAEGIYVRHLRLRLAPSHTKAFEAMMKRCVEAARNSRERAEPLEWLCYRESPGRYWIIQFSDALDGFQTQSGLRGFALDVARAESAEAEGEVWRMLIDLEYETEWEIVTRQKSDWSTVTSMATATHPKARMMMRMIRPGLEEAFETALAARTGFFRDHDYPLPVEGFATRSGAPGLEMQVVFPVDWPSFHETDSFYAFVKSLDQETQDVYAGLKASLMETMSGAEYYDGDFVAELSHSGI
ncbi:MAG: hypothetical protein O7G85_15300 [Planctomycetota bacterium]|nr:hypothetical protein [Planctomycetota bacterium]